MTGRRRTDQRDSAVLATKGSRGSLAVAMRLRKPFGASERGVAEFPVVPNKLFRRNGKMARDLQVHCGIQLLGVHLGEPDVSQEEHLAGQPHADSIGRGIVTR